MLRHEQATALLTRVTTLALPHFGPLVSKMIASAEEAVVREAHSDELLTVLNAALTDDEVPAELRRETAALAKGRPEPLNRLVIR